MKNYQKKLLHETVRATERNGRKTVQPKDVATAVNLVFTGTKKEEKMQTLKTVMERYTRAYPQTRREKEKFAGLDRNPAVTDLFRLLKRESNRVSYLAAVALKSVW